MITSAPVSLLNPWSCVLWTLWTPLKSATFSFTRNFYQNTNNCQVPCFAFNSVCVHTQSAASPYDAGTSWTTSDVSYWWNIRAASILRSDVPACVIPAAHCDVTNREDLGWPFLDTIIRNTCVVILAFNQHVNIPHLTGITSICCLPS